MKNLTWIGIFLLIVGICLIVAGMQERGLAKMSSAVPEEIKLKDLIARGPNGNPNIILTDYVAPGDYVALTKNGSWESVCVPVVPPEMMPQGIGGPFRPPQVQALIRSTSAKTQQEVERICSQPKVRALVTNRIASISAQERTKLSESYPGTDFSQCLIIHEGREPAGATKLMVLLGSGSVLALAGLGCLGVAVFQWSQQGRGTTTRRKKRHRRDEEEDKEDEAPRKRKRPVRAADEDEDEDEAPRKRKRPTRVVDEDEDEAPPRRKRSARSVEEDEDEPAPRKRRRPTRDDDDD